MPKMKFKAKIVGDGSYNVVIFIAGVWRVFGTPFSLGRGWVKPYRHKKNAMRSAENMADILGITLKWEDSQ